MNHHQIDFQLQRLHADMTNTIKAWERISPSPNIVRGKLESWRSDWSRLSTAHPVVKNVDVSTWLDTAWDRRGYAKAAFGAVKMAHATLGAMIKGRADAQAEERYVNRRVKNNDSLEFGVMRKAL